MSLLPPNQQPRINALAGRPNTWDPKFPDIAVKPEQGTYAEPESGGADWERAPASSHCYGWKLLTGGFVKKFYGASVGAAPGTVAVLAVAFKKKVNGSYPDAIDTSYEYYFTSDAVAQNYLQKFRSAAHPGHIVQELIAQGVPYKKKSG